MIPLLVIIPLTSLATPAQVVGGAFETTYEWEIGLPGDQYGAAVASAGDVNADGVLDIIIGAPKAEPGGLIQCGSAYVQSGADGSLLYQWNGIAESDFFGIAVAGVGDLNNDGHADVIVGADQRHSSAGSNHPGHAFVYSGATGNILYQWDGPSPSSMFGSSVANGGDINGDGINDLLVGAPQSIYRSGTSYGPGMVFVYSGADGSMLHQWTGPGFFGSFGMSVARAGDINHDGFGDVVIGAPEVFIPGIGSAGAAVIVSGVDGSLLLLATGTSMDDDFGQSVSGAGDLNGDGTPDWIVGSPGASYLGSFWAGLANVYSGLDGTLLHQWGGITAEWDFFGTSVANAGDCNGDGVEDVLVGAPGAIPPGWRRHMGMAFLYSGADGSLMQARAGRVGQGVYGHAVASAGDLDGDGLAEVIVGDPQAFDGSGNPLAGQTFVYSFNPFLYPNTLSISAAAGGALDLELTFPPSAGMDRYKVLMSESGTGPTHYGVEIPLSLDTLMWQSFFGIYPVSVRSNMHGRLDATGHASASLTIPSGLPNSFIGKTFFFAAIASRPDQLPEYSSAAVAIQIMP